MCVQALVQKLFAAVKADASRDFLVLGEIAALQATGKIPLSVDLMHLGILFELNGSDRDMMTPGHFELDAICDFVERYLEQEKREAHPLAPSLFKYNKEAQSLFGLWQVAADDGIEVIVAWLMAVLQQNSTLEAPCLDDATLDLLKRVLCLDDGWKQDMLSTPSDIETFLLNFFTGWMNQLARFGIKRRA
ncbi:hypothetical protein AC1031_009407 [Aphanomyces cochlioides]|nr:hypothetical protein AC1031_009407 [Aphanomyces cochlioides]